MGPDISAVLIAYNEEDRIGGALQSVAFAQEIIVVDGGSTDRTCEVAHAHGAKVIVRPFSDFGSQKQFALEQASGTWVLSLDADERISPALAAEIQDVVSGGPEEVSGFLCPRRNHYLGRHIRHAGWWPDLNLRLVRRVRARFSDHAVHESLEVDGAVGRLQGEIVHISHRTLSDHLRKVSLYSSLWAEQARTRGLRAHWWDLVLRPLHHFVKRYLVHQGFRDGLPGLFLCTIGAFHVFFKYACLMEPSLSTLGPENEGQ